MRLDRIAPIAVSLVLLAAAAPSAAAGRDMPGVDVAGLAASDVEALATLMSEGACPCDPKRSLLECIQARSCAKATDLARYGAKKLREGLGIEQVREAVVKKYLDDNVSFTFDLEGVPRKGAEKGRITIVEFADFECPHCALLAKVLPQVLAAYPNEVTLYFKHFPLPMHTYAEAAARAAWAAGRQGRFWQMHDLIFQNQGSLSPERFVAFARELGLNVEKFKADMESPAAHEAIARDRKEGMESGLSGTPTLYINGKLYYEDKTAEALKAHIEALLKNKGAK